MRRNTTFIVGTLSIVAISAGVAMYQQIHPNDPERPAAVVTLTCNAESRTYVVNLHDPANGEVIETRRFMLDPSMETMASCSSNIPGPGLRSAFDEDFKHLAVRKKMSAHGSHVGIVAQSAEMGVNSKFTDLSGDTKGFGAYVNQSKPAFGPGGKLYFVQSDKQGVSYVHSVEPSKGSKPKRAGSGQMRVGNEGVKAPFYYLPGSTSPQTDNTPFAVYMNDGWGFSTDADNGTIVYGNLNGKGKSYTVDLPHGKGGQQDYTIRMDPRVALNRSTFLGLSPTYDRLYVVHINRETVDLTDGLTYTNGSVTDPQLSPNGKSIVYVVEGNNGKRTLHRVALDGTKLGTPKTLANAKLSDSRTWSVRLLTEQ